MSLWPAWTPDPAKYPHIFPFSPRLASRPCWSGASLEDIETLFHHCGVGTAKSPGELGRRLMLDSWIGRGKHSTPNSSCMAALKAWPCPRVQLWSLEPGAREDLPSAYPSHYRVHPCGTSVRVRRVEEPWLCTWFARCRIMVPHELPLGPFPIREDAGRARPKLAWPVDPGSYETWLWAEQAFDCRAAGCEVEMQDGWGWHLMTNDNAPWVDHMLALRDTAPGGRGGMVGLLVKRATNEAIGCQGIGVRYQRPHRLRPGEEVRASDRLMTDEEGYQTDEVLRWFMGRATMIHWQRYTEMQVARTMYARALPYAEQGRLVAIWTDCLEVAA